MQWQTMLFITIVNAWILHRYINGASKATKYKAFFTHLVKELAKKGGQHRKHSQGDLAPPTNCHMPVTAAKCRTCVLCRDGVRIHGNCLTICSTCWSVDGGPIYLHAGKRHGCFLQHHRLH